jgi:putative PIN family toxin of toxin-antitoxin system
VRIVLDTNVFVSAVFFGGVPGRILTAWRDGRLQLVLSPAILDEYRRVGEALGAQYTGIDLSPVLALLAIGAEIVDAPALPEPVSVDPDDDKFLACASAAGVEVLVSGDKHLVDHDGWRGLQVLRPRQFADTFLSSR